MSYIAAHELVDREGVEFLYEVTDDRHTKKGRLGEERNTSWRKTKQEHGIDQGVWMIEDEDDGPVERHVLDSRDLDSPEVNPQRKSQERNNDMSDHAVPWFSALVCG